MENLESLSNVRFECKYHVAFIPNYRKMVIHVGGQILNNVGGQILNNE